MQRKKSQPERPRSTETVVLQQISEVIHNPDRERFELYVAGDLVGVLSYRIENVAGGQRVAIVLHTILYDEYTGHGLGTRLTGGAMAYMREQRLRVRPVCSFTQRFLRAHPGMVVLAPD
ncbi:MAG: GNAT family N-acetyltransferase [Gordonia sp. (in: high G+C Gram-positive bacteria)]